MNRSESIREIAAALSKAQGEYKGAIKSATNPHYRSKYADLESVFGCIQEPFAKYGLSYSQGRVKGEPFFATVIMHTSGEWIESYVDFQIASNATPQMVKSATTYAKRNGLEAAAGVPSTDDDGNLASGKSSPLTPDSAESQPPAFDPSEDLAFENLPKEPPKTHAPPIKPQGEAPKPPPNTSNQHDMALITEAQRKRLYAIANKYGWTEAMIKEQIHDLYGIDSTKKLNRHNYDDLISKIEFSRK